MLASSAQYRQALPFPVRRETRIEVFHSGVRVFDNLPFVTGNVTASLTARVSRTLQLSVDPQFYPALPTDLLAPEIAVLKVSTGIGYPDGTREVFPVFTGRVAQVDHSADGSVLLQGEDLAADVVDFRFEQPQPSIVGNSIVTEIQRLIRQVLPGAVFGVNDVIDFQVPALVWDEDRGQALDQLAQALKGRWYALGDGTFVVRKYPYSTGVSVLTMVDQSGGLLMTADVTRSRTNAANSITVVSERMDGTAPIRQTARDINPASPTYFFGPYGKVSQIIKVQTPLSAAEAQELANARLAATIAFGQQWAIHCVPDATLEPGDTITVSYRGQNAVQVIDRMDIPLSTRGDMTLSCRSSVPEPIAS